MDPLVSHGRSDPAKLGSPPAMWGAPFVSGLLLTILGTVAFWTPALSGVASALLIGGVLAAAGTIELVGALRNHRRASIVLPLLSGILSLVVGLLFIARPLLGVAALGVLLAAYFFATGLFRGITALADRYPRWNWDFGYGVVAVSAGVVTLLDWPLSSLVLVGMLVGLELMARGVALMAIGWQVRHFLHSGRHQHSDAPASM